MPSPDYAINAKQAEQDRRITDAVLKAVREANAQIYRAQTQGLDIGITVLDMQTMVGSRPVIVAEVSRPLGKSQ